MAATGTTTLNFGPWPGSTDTSVTITGQTSIVAGSFVEAWVYPADTPDHSVDEHVVDAPVVTAGNIVAGVGFTIYGCVPDRYLTYGQWQIAWVWS